MSKRPATPGSRASPALSKKSRPAKVYEIESDSDEPNQQYRLRDVSDSAGTHDVPASSTGSKKATVSTKVVSDVGLTTAQRLQEARKASEQYKTLANRRLNRIAGAVAKLQQSNQAVAAANAKVEAMDGQVKAAKADAAVSEAKVTVLQSEVVELACEREELRQTQDALAQLLECTVCYATLKHAFLIVPCGHSACGLCLAKWFANTKPPRCPTCQAPATGVPLPNHMVRHIAEQIGASTEGAAEGERAVEGLNNGTAWKDIDFEPTGAGSSMDTSAA
ncbi:hypothetical protein EV122DRAFT_256666 [Schizophyllum commune]